MVRIGRHTVEHGDVMDGISDLMGGNKVDIMYSDPPWGQGNIRYWQTMNQKMNGAEKRDILYDDFLKQIFKIADAYVTDFLFVEYGCQWKNDIIDYGTTNNFVHNGIVGLKYRAGSVFRPLDLHVFNRTEKPLDSAYIKNVSDTSGYKTLQRAIIPFADKTKSILDPCCGMGYTAQIAVDTGMTFYGNELNFKRLNKTIQRLKKDERQRD